MLSLTTTEQQFFALLRAALSGEEAFVENADWAALFALAGQQKLLPIFFEAACKTPAAADGREALFASTRQQVLAQVLGQTVREAEFSALYASLREAGLHPVVVKGQLCSRLYPLRGHRLSADDDLLIPDEELLRCHEVLVKNGLATSCPVDELAQADEIPYRKSGSMLYIELHRRLFDSSDSAPDDLNRFFQNVLPVEEEGFLTLPAHEHLLYLILHACKHFVGSGVGVRQICDIGLWAREHHAAVDWPLLHAQCAAVHAERFAAAAFAAARDALGIAFAPPAPWDDVPEVEPLLHDALCGGVYGSSSTVRLHAATVTKRTVKASRDGKNGSALAALFPPRSYMQRQYPYVKRSALLLPAAWAQRALHYLRQQRSAPASAPLQLAKERVELLKLYGVME